MKNLLSDSSRRCCYRVRGSSRLMSIFVWRIDFDKLTRVVAFRATVVRFE